MHVLIRAHHIAQVALIQTLVAHDHLEVVLHDKLLDDVILDPLLVRLLLLMVEHLRIIHHGLSARALDLLVDEFLDELVPMPLLVSCLFAAATVSRRFITDQCIGEPQLLKLG